MEMLVSNDWLREKIIQDPDIECDAGAPIILLENLGMFIASDLSEQHNEKVIELKMAFSTLIRQLRRRDKLTIAQLAEKAEVDEYEIKSIEHDTNYLPRPRTIHKLAIVFDIPPRKLMKLSSATINVDSDFQDEAMRFAASSDKALVDLSDDERLALNEYIKYLHDNHDN